MSSYRSKRRASNGEAAATLVAGALLVAFVIAIAALINGIVFFLLWNDFVIQHVSGAGRVSFGGAVLAGLGVALLTNSGNAANRD